METLIILGAIFVLLLSVAVVAFGFWGLAVTMKPNADWGPVRGLLIFAAILFPAFVFLVQLLCLAVNEAGIAELEGTGFASVIGTPAIVFAIFAINLWALSWWIKRVSNKDR